MLNMMLLRQVQVLIPPEMEQLNKDGVHADLYPIYYHSKSLSLQNGVTATLNVKC